MLVGEPKASSAMKSGVAQHTASLMLEHIVDNANSSSLLRLQVALHFGRVSPDIGETDDKYTDGISKA